MAKLTQDDIFGMFRAFGISRDRVVQLLNSCKDRDEARVAFERMKEVVDDRFSKMNSKEQSDLRAIRDRLMRIELKNYNPPAQTDTHLNARLRQAAQVYDMMKSGDIRGLSKMLDPDSVDPEFEESFIRNLLNRMSKK